MSYEIARNAYAALGVDADAALERLRRIPVSLHCWQGDDVRGFDTDPHKPLTGGIQTTGSYPGRARTPQELMADLDAALKLCPGAKKLNLHASYAVFARGEWADRDALEPRHFAPWVEFCKAHGLGADFNPTFFFHPKCDPLTLSSPNEATRRFWIEHGKACVRISQYLAEELGQVCTMTYLDGRRVQGRPPPTGSAPGGATGRPSTRSCRSRSIFKRSSRAWRARCSASAWRATRSAPRSSALAMQR